MASLYFVIATNYGWFVGEEVATISVVARLVVEILTGEPIAFASLTATHIKNEAIKANMATDATSTIRAVGCLDSISIANETRAP